MNLFKTLTKVVLSPIKAVAEVVEDLKGDNGDSSQFASIATLGISSVVKGAAKAVAEASEEVFDD